MRVSPGSAVFKGRLVSRAARDVAAGAAERGLWARAYCLTFKPWLDLLVASLLVLALAPLFLVVLLALGLDRSGPAIFRQTRVGREGRPFTVYKFRTMIPDRRARRLPYGGQERRRRHKSEHDPRVTPIGRFLRRTSIDELPQLVNVLRGEMSLVGPRPELPEIVSRYAPWQHDRHRVRPGLTGWWQISGRGQKPMHENTELDVYYVVNQSFWLDLKILLRTLPVLLSRTGAF